MSARVVTSSSGALDDAAAQLSLRAALERLETAPLAFLGLTPDATPSQTRAAFLGLTKQFHPTKYARFSPETVRLANEVFLTLKRVCDGLSRPRASTGKAQPAAPAAQAAAATRPSATRPPPVAVRPPGRSGPIPAQRSEAPVAAHVPARTATPMRGVPQTGRTPRIAAAQPPPAAQPPAIAAGPAVAGATSRIPRLDVGDNERGHFEQGLELLRRRLWSDGERLFTQLSVAVPTDKRYRAYRDYARGRIAQDLGRHDEARTEWQRALALDPTLTAAKLALEQLPEPEPTKPTGLLGKLFRR